MKEDLPKIESPSAVPNALSDVPPAETASTESSANERSIPPEGGSTEPAAVNLVQGDQANAGAAEPRRRTIGWTDQLIGLGLTAFYLIILMATSTELGMSRDEGFYVDAAQSYAAWFELLWNDPDAAMEQAQVDRYWSNNHEHPSLVKSLFALSWIAHQRYQIFSNDSLAFRFPAMLMSAAVLWLVYLFGARARSRTVGVLGALFYGFCPNVFYNSHLNCFDTPVIFMLTWTTYAYWRSLEKKRWAIATGIIYGLCLETKHNAWILPAVLLVHWVWWAVVQRQRGARLSRIFPWWMVTMATIGPLLFYALWPWMWFETWSGPGAFARTSEYVNFHVHHVHYNIAYLGRTYFGPPGPIHYPFVMTLFTVSMTTVALWILGLGLRAKGWLPNVVLRLFRIDAPARDSQLTDVLWLGSAFTPLLVIALPSTPIFGGTKHFLGGYVYFALFGAMAAEALVQALTARYAAWRSTLKNRSASALRWLSPKLVTLVLFGLLLAPAVRDTAHSHPYGLSFYGMAAGGVPGAADLGMVRQFWGFTTGSLVPWMNREMRRNSSIWVCDMTPTAFQMLHRDGRLRPDIRIAWDIPSSDYAIVHHEDHFAEVDYQIWEAFGRVDPVYVLTYDGVPIISVYENPRGRR